MAEPAHVSWTWEERAQCLGTGTAGINWDQMLTFYDGMDDAMLGPGTLEILEVLGVRFRDSDAVFSEVILGQVFETIMKDGLTAVNASEAYSKIDGQATVILSPLARVLRLIVENSGLKRLAGEFKDWLVDSTCRLSTNLEHEGVCLELLEHLVAMESTDPPGALQLERLCSSGAASSSPRLVQSTLEMTNRLFDGSSIFVGSLLGLVLRHRVCPHIGGKAGEKWKTKPGDPLARRKIRELSGRVREVCAELLAKTAETLRQRKKDRAFMGWQKVSEEITNLPSIFNLSDQDALMVCIRAWPSYAAMVAIPDCPVLAKFNVIAKLMQDFLQMEEGSLRKEALLAWKEFGTFWIAQPGFNYKMLSILIRPFFQGKFPALSKNKKSQAATEEREIGVQTWLLLATKAADTEGMNKCIADSANGVLEVIENHGLEMSDGSREMLRGVARKLEGTPWATDLLKLANAKAKEKRGEQKKTQVEVELDPNYLPSGSIAPSDPIEDVVAVDAAAEALEPPQVDETAPKPAPDGEGAAEVDGKASETGRKRDRAPTDDGDQMREKSVTFAAPSHSQLTELEVQPSSSDHPPHLVVASTPPTEDDPGCDPAGAMILEKFSTFPQAQDQGPGAATEGGEREDPLTPPGPGGPSAAEARRLAAAVKWDECTTQDILTSATFFTQLAADLLQRYQKAEGMR